MSLYLVVISGPHRGRRFALTPDFSIGRRHGDLLLEDDPKVSGLHAKVRLDNKGQMVLIDLDSANGLVLGGRKVKKIAMMPGVNFRLGSTSFQVVSEGLQTQDPSPLGPQSPIEGPPVVVMPTPQRPEPPKTWRGRLADDLRPMLEQARTIVECELAAFSPALILDFIEGFQVGESMTLGYGPREVGFDNLDVALTDPHLPEQAFELRPVTGGVEIRDLTPGEVLVNSKGFESRFLQEGDLIQIGKTQIKVRYL